MALTRAEVEKVAQLARLKFSAEELDQFTSQLSQIIDYVEQLADLPTDATRPMSHSVELQNVFRADTVADSLPRDAALANAPRHDEEFFLVPPVLD